MGKKNEFKLHEKVIVEMTDNDAKHIFAIGEIIEDTPQLYDCWWWRVKYKFERQEKVSVFIEHYIRHITLIDRIFGIRSKKLTKELKEMKKK